MNLNKIELHKVITCREEDSVAHVAETLKKHKERRIFVVDDKGKLQGIITTTDLVYKALTSDKQKLTAKEVMSKEVKAVETHEDLNKALEIMNNLKSFSCPVTEHGKIIGLVSYHDLLGHVMSSLKE